MMTIGELSALVESVRSQAAAGRPEDALKLYYARLDTELYSLGQNLRMVGLLGEFLEDGKSPLPSLDHGLQERLSRSLIAVYQLTGQPHKAISLANWLLDSSEIALQPRTKAIVLRYLSRIQMSVGQLKSAEASIAAGVSFCQAAGESGLETGLRRQLGILWAYEGRYLEARSEIAKLPKGFGKHNHSDFSVYADKLLYGLEDPSESNKLVYYANELHKLAQKYHYKNDEVVAAWSLGFAYLSAGDLGKASSYLENAATLCEVTSYKELKPDILLAKARCLLSAKQSMHIVLETAKNGLSIAANCGYSLKQAEIQNFLGTLSLEHGESSVAEQYARVAYETSLCDGPPHWYKRGFKEAERILARLNITPPMKYCSCFISYSHHDKDFADKLHNALRVHDVECWLDEHQILPGDYFLGNIDEGIKKYDKVLLCCSEKSLTSFWVDTEIEKAVHKEKTLWDEHQERTLVMIPLDLDGFLHKGWDDPKASILRSRLSADFTEWASSEEKFTRQLEGLLMALRIPQKSKGSEPRK